MLLGHHFHYDASSNGFHLCAGHESDRDLMWRSRNKVDIDSNIYKTLEDEELVQESTHHESAFCKVISIRFANGCNKSAMCLLRFDNLANPQQPWDVTVWRQWHCSLFLKYTIPTTTQCSHWLKAWDEPEELTTRRVQLVDSLVSLDATLLESARCQIHSRLLLSTSWTRPNSHAISMLPTGQHRR